MRILQVNADWDQGGPGTIGKDLCDVLLAYQHECIVAYGRQSVVENAPGFQLDTRAEFVAHAFLSRVFGNEGCYSQRATRRLIRLIERYRPDIVHLHNLLGHYINHEILFRYLERAGIPTFWTIHDCSPFTGHCINFERVKCEKWKTQCQQCPLYKTYPYSYFLDTSRATYDKRKQLYGSMRNLHLIVPSQWMKKQVEASFLKERDIHLLYNGINLDRFRPTESDIRERYYLSDKRVLVAAAYNWNEMKGWNLLLELAEKLDERYALVVIGNKDEGAVSPRMVSVPVITDQAELAKWYSAADVFVNPTLGDNFPTVNIEALACGTPIVTCDTGGSPEIAGNDFGRIVYSKTSDEFLEKIESCYSMSYRPEDCHQYAMRFDRRACYQEYLRLYESILQGS